LLFAFNRFCQSYRNSQFPLAFLRKLITALPCCYAKWAQLTNCGKNSCFYVSFQVRAF
jgi:hypothetical protein